MYHFAVSNAVAHITVRTSVRETARWKGPTLSVLKLSITKLQQVGTF